MIIYELRSFTSGVVAPRMREAHGVPSEEKKQKQDELRKEYKLYFWKKTLREGEEWVKSAGEEP